mgnify:CR=1 FL=1
MATIGVLFSTDEVATTGVSNRASARRGDRVPACVRLSSGCRAPVFSTARATM